MSWAIAAAGVANADTPDSAAVPKTSSSACLAALRTLLQYPVQHRGLHVKILRRLMREA